MIIKDAQLKDLPIISLLHERNLESPGSKIGIVYLTALYRSISSNPDLHTLLVAKVKNQIIGAICITKDLKRTNRLLKKNLRIKLIFAIFHALLSGKLPVSDLLNRILFERKALSQFKSPYPTVVSLFVARKFQKRGVGRLLVGEVIKRCKIDGSKLLYVDTYLSNKKARKFYKAVGFQEVVRIIDSVVMKYELK